MAKSMLRLLSLAACAEVIVSFGTIARSGGDVEIGTESAGADLGFCICAARPTCGLAGYPSLEQPLSGAMSDNTLAGEVTTCWNLCYKDDAPFFPSCKEGRDVFIAGICSGAPVANPSYGSGWSYKKRLQADATEDNPFKDPDAGCGAGQTEFLDLRSAADRCEPIIAPRAGPSIYSTESSCGKAVKKYPFADRAATCPNLYMYSCDTSGTRIATYCEWDAGVCKAATNPETGLKKTSAPECKQLLCTGDDATDPSNPACKMDAPQCK